MILPYIILFTIPIFFSHILLPFFEYPIEIFGYVFGETSSFERVKVLLFFVLVFLGILEVLFRKNKIFFDKIQKDGKVFLGIMLFPILVFFGRNIGKNISDESWNFFLLGSHEKFHGYFFYLACVSCFFLFSFIQSPSRLIKTSLASASIVALFAVLEYTKLWQFFPYESVSWEMGRTLSTLGNPNYVAGYILLHLPLCFTLRSPERYIFLIFLILAIITTGSFIGLGLTGVFLLWKVFEIFLPTIQKKFHRLRNPRILISIFFCIVALLGFSIARTIGHEKWLSFESRGVLVSDIAQDMWHHPLSILFGKGPDSIILHYAGERSAILDSYFPHDSSIDSAHDIWIDTIYQFGIFIFGGLLFLIWKRICYISDSEKLSLLLFFLFFSFNIVVIAPLIPIIFLLSYDKNQRFNYISQG